MDAAGQYHEKGTCKPKSRCHDWKNCDHCAAVRQAKIADAAERHLAGQADLRLYTAKAVTGSDRSIGSIRRSMTDALAPHRGIWTIEQSAYGPELHLHIIAPAADLPKIRECETWRSDPIRNLRHATAYITKRRNAPTPIIYPGRLYGTFGQLLAHLLDKNTPALVHAAALEQLLTTSPELANTEQPTPTSRLLGLTPRQTASHWLPRLHEIAGRTVQQIRP